MTLSEDQIKDYIKNGFLMIENVFSECETYYLLAEMREIVKENDPRKILEKNGCIRSFFEPEFNSKLFSDVIKLKRLVQPAIQLIGSDVYKHQTKLNTKQALFGDY